MSDAFAMRLNEAQKKHRENVQTREGEFFKAIQNALVNRAEYRALRDFELYWLPTICQAHMQGRCTIDNRKMKDRSVDELYGWAIQKLLSQELGNIFEIVGVKPYFRKPFVRVSWTDKA